MKIIKPIHWWFKANFGLNKKEWKKYFLFTIPIVLSSILYSANGFIDNFMVTHIKDAVTALSYANAWIGILFSFLLGINIVGSMLYGQFRGMRDKKHIILSTRARYFLSISVSLILFTACQVCPEVFINVFAGNTDGGGKAKGVIYIRWISISWLITSWTFVTSNIMRELKSGKLVLISNIGMIITNILLNILFIFILEWDVAGAAYATIISQIVYICLVAFFLRKHHRFYLVNFIPFWTIDKLIWKLYGKRTLTIVITSFSVIFITIRGAFWNRGFPEGSIIDINWPIGGALVLSITLSISNILTSALPSIGASVSIYVGRYLGRDEKERAIANAYKLRGFNFVLSAGISLFFLIFVFFLGEISYFSKGVETKVFDFLQNKNFSIEEAVTQSKIAADLYLKQIQLTLIPILFINPIWAWINTTTKVFSSGGKTNLISLLDFLMNFGQLMFLIFIIFGLSPILRDAISPLTILPIMWTIFFIFEAFLKLPILEFMIQKGNWANKIENKI